MEEILTKVIYMRENKLKKYLEVAKHNYESGEMVLDTASDIVTQLKGMISKLQDEIRHYTSTSPSPQMVVVTNAMEIQLEAEDFVVEIEKSMVTAAASVVPIRENSMAARDIGVKLPKLELPKFNGQPLKWLEFWDRFASNIDSQPMAEADKLTYLISSLEGKALESVAGISITNHNYTIAVEELKSRFGSNDTLIDAHYTALTNLERAEYTASSCRRIIDEIERHLRALEKLGEKTTGNHLRATILSKFPEQVLHQFHLMPQQSNIKDNSTSRVRRIVMDIVVAMEKAQTTPILTPKGLETKPEVITTEVLQTKAENPLRNVTNYKQKRNLKRKIDSRVANNIPQKRNRLPCIFCKLGNHNSIDCRKYSDVESRKKQLMDRCHKCLRRNHKTDQCHRKITCFRCGEEHLQLLCPNPKGNKDFMDSKPMAVKCYITNNFTFLQTAVAQVTNPNNKINKLKCRLVLDSGSQRSYISAKAATKLQLIPDNEDRLLVYTFGATDPKEMSSPSVDIVLRTKRDIKKQVRVNIVPHITEKLPVAKFDASTVDLVADDDSTGENVDILIGNDYYAGFMRQGKERIQNELYRVDSDFGWLLSGNVENLEHTVKEENVLTVTTYCHCHDSSCPYFTEPDLPLRNIDIKFLWSLECIGITDSPKATRQEEAVRHFNDTVQYRDGRYQVKWPWIQYPPDLPSNFGLALGRLRSILKRLDKPALDEYESILKEQLDLGIIEAINQEDTQNSDHPLHYLPHHMVKQKGKKGRIVYDASAKTTGQKSLNECLYSGPSMLEDLIVLLLKFRTKKIGLMADVEKAFLQVALQEDDRDVTRFLWIKDINKEVTEDNLLHLRFCRVPFGVVSSPFLLTATIQHHMTQSNEELLKTIAHKCYVDNLVTGANSTQEAIEIYSQTRSSFEQLSMNIRDWMSNDKEFMDTIPEAHKAEQRDDVKVLGLYWNLSEDRLKLNMTPNLCNIDRPANTKRKVLQALARIYDPCGFICPLILPMKLIFQDICELKVKWDTELPANLILSVHKAIQNLKIITDIQIPRYIGSDTSKGDFVYQLHCFTDASKNAYSAVVYIKVTSQEQSSISFLMAKSHVSQAKDKNDVKIPKLELLGFLIGSRLLKYIRNNLELEIAKEYLWTDSMVVLCWMKSNKLLPPFVANRVNEIKRNHPNTEMCYINTKSNPADIATRPELFEEKMHLWYNGPDFLIRNESTWPEDRRCQENQNLLSFGEVLGDSPREQSGEVPVDEDRGLSEPLELSVRPSDPTGDEASQGQSKPIEYSEYPTDELMELDNSDNQLKEPDNQKLSDKTEPVYKIKELQRKHFPEELDEKRTHLARNLDLFLDVDGILRCRGRMANTTWDYDMKHPILLPKDCEFTNKIIKDTHEANYHVGATHTLSLIREKYWIPQGKRQVVRVISRCQRCVKHGGGPYRLPMAPDLPNERVSYSTPFTYCGLDYFGPLYVNTPNGKQKRWVSLFTCLAVRAIHLEIVNDLTAEECLLALRRFAATRNTPKRLYSDNASYFKLTSEVVRKPFCISKGIEWRFICQLAPWHGGYYERLIGLVKHCLKRTLEKHLLGDSKLLTVLKEVEAVVNSRPLTKVGTEVIHILRPSDFLSLGKCLTLTPATDSVCTVDGSKLQANLIESWKKGLIILEEFKKIFIAQYLTSLRERYQNSPKQPRVVSNCEPKLGDIVQIKSDVKNRELWKVGKIEQLIKSADNKHRVAKVKVGDSILTRSVGHLYPLETESDISTQSGPIEKEPGAPPLDAPIEYLDLDIAQNRVERLQPQSPTDAVPEGHDDEVGTANEVMPRQENIMNTETSSSEDATNSDNMQFGTRAKRDAAIRAREKILEWTRHLLTLLH